MRKYKINYRTSNRIEIKKPTKKCVKIVDKIAKERLGEKNLNTKSRHQPRRTPNRTKGAECAVSCDICQGIARPKRPPNLCSRKQIKASSVGDLNTQRTFMVQHERCVAQKVKLKTYKCGFDKKIQFFIKFQKLINIK